MANKRFSTHAHPVTRWNVLQVVAGIALAFCLLAGCSTAGPNGTGSVFTPVPTDVNATSTPANITPPPTLTPTPLPTPTPPPAPTPTLTPETKWQADGGALGPFEFIVSSDNTTILEIDFHVSNLQCGPVNITADATISGSWPINHGNFTLDAVPNPLLDVIITGTLAGSLASGTWKGIAFGANCTGSWTGSIQ